MKTRGATCLLGLLSVAAGPAPAQPPPAQAPAAVTPAPKEARANMSEVLSYLRPEPLLWEPLCYAQIGGLTIATFLTLLLVPVIYSVFVLDLRWVAWDGGEG